MKLSTVVFVNKPVITLSSCLQQSVIKPSSYVRSTNYKRQMRCYRERHRSGYTTPRFNVVALLIQPSFILALSNSASGFAKTNRHPEGGFSTK